ALEFAQADKRQLTNPPEGNDTLGFIYYKKNLGTLAVPLLESTVATDPSNPEYHYHLGLAYGQTADKTKASRALTRGLVFKPDSKGAQNAGAALAELQG